MDGTSCSQTYVRTCVGQKCGGADCSGLEGGNAVKQEPCYENGAWVSGAWGPCKGSCGTMKGKQDGVVTCSGACCDPTTKSLVLTTQSCDLAYGTWQPGTWGNCQVPCGTGTRVRTLGCDDLINNCCDPATKSSYPTRESCTNGCCAKTLVVGYNDQTKKDITAEFPRANDGATVSLNSTGWFCPVGFSGNPTVTCTGINFGPVSPVNNECVPADCDESSVNRTQNICNTSKAPGCSLTATFPNTLNGKWGTIYCTDYVQGSGAGYTGTATMQCDHGAWVVPTLVAGCIPNCPADPMNIGLSLTGPFPETQDPGGLGVPVSYDCSVAPYTQGDACGDARYVGTPSRTCNAGTWSGLSGSCDYKSCNGVSGTFCNAVICWTFIGDSYNIHETSKTLVCKTDVNGLYEGNVSATCDYGKWCPPTSGDCVAASCSAWTTSITADDGNPVDVTFAEGTPSGIEVNGTETDPLHKCNVSSKCCYGIWVDPAINCSSVNISTLKSYSTDCTCWAVKCRDDTSTFTTPVANATKCSASSGDPFDEMVTDDIYWSIVPADNVSGGGCTTTKCEYKCTDGYKLVGYECKLPVCTPVGSNPDPSGLASMCLGDGNPSVDTAKTLVASLADCGAPKCEYYCGGSYKYCSSTTRCYTPLTCASHSLCNGGSISKYDGCSWSLTCKTCDCTSPCGNGTITNGNPDTCYSASSVACGILCSSVSQTATCSGGVWSSSTFASTYTNQTCSVTACANCTGPDGTTILHGNSKTYYSFNQANCNCSSQSRTCNNGTLSGTYTGTTCSGIPCCGDGSCYGPPQPSTACSNYKESCTTCSTDCTSCTVRSFTVAVNNGTQGRTWTCGDPYCSGVGCQCWDQYDGYGNIYDTCCYFYNKTTVTSTPSLCSSYTCSTITVTSVNGGGCLNPGTPGNSCTVTLSQ